MSCPTRCAPGRSKYSLCRPVRCDTDDPCPCTPRSAYSCRPAKKDCCETPTPKLIEAFGTFIPVAIEGVTGTPGFPIQNSSCGVAGFTGGANGVVDGQTGGITGLWQINFEKGFFSDCPEDPNPSIVITPCLIDTSFPFLNEPLVFCGPRSKDSFQVQLTNINVAGGLTDNMGFDFRAVQKPVRDCK